MAFLSDLSLCSIAITLPPAGLLDAGTTGMPEISDVSIDGDTLSCIEQTLAAVLEQPVETPLHLSFGNHWGSETLQPALLGAALMGSLSGRELTVDLQEADSVGPLVRSGVAAALWRRPRPKTHFAPAARVLDSSLLGAVWTVGSRRVTDALFAAAAPELDDAAVTATRATFVNPHLSRRDDGDPDVAYLIGRWLARRVGTERMGAVREAAGVIGELIRNVAEHAPGRSGQPVQSILRVSLQQTTLQVTVMDAGVGLCESLRLKLADDVLEGLADDDALVAALQADDLPYWHSGRGVGLARVRDFVGSAHGSLAIAANAARYSTTTDVALGQFELQGTVVDLSVDLAAAAT